MTRITKIIRPTTNCPPTQPSLHRIEDQLQNQLADYERQAAGRRSSMKKLESQLKQRLDECQKRDRKLTDGHELLDKEKNRLEKSMQVRNAYSFIIVYNGESLV